MDLIKDLQGQKFRCICADPPWTPSLHAKNPRRATLDKAGPQKHYPTMTVPQICDLSPPSEDQCHLWLWVLTQHIDWGYVVARAWGFNEIATMLTWCKPGLGVGRFQCNTEHVLVCRKGRKAGNPFGFGGRNASTTKGTWFQWPRGRHSEKPQGFFDVVETVSPGPYLEMFARRPRENWTVWGNEVEANVPHERLAKGDTE
jgi:N6-adenosine-specific RNA methylase IME4